MKTYQIAFTAIAATANAVAQITIPGRCKLKQVVWSFRDNQTGADGEAVLQLSKASATEIGVNGAQQVISNVTLEKDLVTSGMAQGGVHFVHPVDESLDQGQILYVHAAIDALTVSGACLLHTT